MQTPIDWTTSVLDTVTSKPTKLDPATTGRKTIRYVDIGLLDGPAGVIYDAPEIQSATAPSRCRQLLRHGDTIYSTVRPYLQKMALVGEGVDQEFASTGYCVLRPSVDLLPKYLYYFTLSPQFAEQILPKQKGVSYPAVLDREVRECRVWFPDLEEQRRIVEVVEDHFSRLDAAANYAAAASKRLGSLRDQLVRDAVTGRKVAGGRQEPVLSDVGTNDGELPMLPSGWMWRRLEDVADVVGGITKDSKKQSDPAFIEVPYLRVANVQRGSLRLDEVTTIRVAPAKAEALRLRPGDVLLNEGGDRDKLARGWVWQGEIENCIHQNHVFRARARDGLDPYFLSWTTNTIGGRWAERNGKQSVNLASISLSMIRKMPVIVPPRDAASHIIQQLHEQLASVDQTSRQIEALQLRGSALRRAVLVAAFSGRLTGHRKDQELIEELADIPSSYSGTMVTA